MAVTPKPTDNRLLAALAPDVFQRLAADLQPVHLALGASLYEPGSKLQHAYFPTTAIVSLHYITESGASTEVAGVGNEGMVGVGLFMGSASMSSAAMVGTAGSAFRLDARVLRQEFSQAGGLQSLLLLYAMALMAQYSQNAVCNRHHSVDEKLSRWLLETLDRNPDQPVVITQELMANMLGVRRESVTVAAGKLQQAGCVSYRRGHIGVLDRSALEHRTCECYGALKKEVAGLLPSVRPR
ncbi:MAG: Crp/Fnr family transcriptional regulator [Burkholderiales bacterium PBB3]|nr:MAG: Crp/Fnr family transcriptional regulator [Burkholderiales bacterium PBB3]